MNLVELKAIPNQKFAINVDKNRYSIALNAINDFMAATIYRNGDLLIAGVRCVAKEPLIPYTYLENGNFVFTTENDDLPWYEQFGVTQQLLYLSNDDLAALRASV